MGYGARLQVEMLTPKSIRLGSGGRIPRLFFLPIEITNHFLFWTKKKVSVPGPVHLHLWQEHSRLHLTALQALHPVPGLLKAPGAV